ncbi:MAG: hypothetical protein JST92_07065, partial [Deltaproteobacteria bacterium]|nr:hypothetical protein [Deltaproteobacteria bacterium]
MSTRNLWFVAGTAVLALFVACATGKPATGGSPASGGKKLIIVGINDTHGSILSAPAPKRLQKITNADVGGADWFGGYMTALRADAKEKGNEVIILDGGDLFQGTLISNQFQGKSVVDVYNQIG